MEQSSTQEGVEQKAMAAMNRHLLFTDKHIELSKERVKLENWKASPQVGENLFGEKKKDSPSNLDLSQDRRESQVLNDLKRNEKQTDYVSPDSLIQSQLSASGEQSKYEQEYRKEYSRQFIENARKAGYEVVVNENYVVTSVKKIKGEDRAHLFKADNSGAE